MRVIWMQRLIQKWQIRIFDTNTYLKKTNKQSNKMDEMDGFRWVVGHWAYKWIWHIFWRRINKITKFRWMCNVRRCNTVTWLFQTKILFLNSLPLTKMWFFRVQSTNWQIFVNKKNVIFELSPKLDLNKLEFPIWFSILISWAWITMFFLTLNNNYEQFLCSEPNFLQRRERNPTFWV